nr:hypothetical protein [Saccharopolyspora sp. HNM0986]
MTERGRCARTRAQWALGLIGLIGLAPLWRRYMLSGIADTVAAVEREAAM